MLRQIDFSDFEAQFKLKEKANKSSKMSRIQKMMKKSAEKITFVDSDRARNMSEYIEFIWRKTNGTVHRMCH